MKRRHWVPREAEDYVQKLSEAACTASSTALDARLTGLIAENRRIHEQECVNLNPATNVMNPKAEAALAAGLGSRPSLGYPGDKYEMGLEAIEQIEVIAATLACEIFEGHFAEIRVGSGALANLYAFMATCKPGDAIIVPPSAIGGHVTHHAPGAAGLYGLNIFEAPVDPHNYMIDVPGLEKLADAVKPKLITLGGSLNLQPHPAAEARRVADRVGAALLFDAAHLCGMIAGKAWPNPLHQGAHLMTMSTYKSLGGPAGGLVVTNDQALAERLDHIAFPGLTANFDAGKSASLAITLLDWREYGKAYAAAMADTATALARALLSEGVAVFQTQHGATSSHQFALEAAPWGGGQTAARKLRSANILSCGIDLPLNQLEGDLNGLRFGTPEIVRWGLTAEDMPELAGLIAKALRSNDPLSLGPAVSDFRKRFKTLHFIRT
jgi:glycine hydroxymethyltransferase